jgi:hypothetical protein
MFAGWLPQGAEAVGQDVIILAAIVTAVGVLVRQGWKVVKFFRDMAEHIADVPKLRADLQGLAEERRADTAEFRAEIANLRAENTEQHAASGKRLDAIESHLTTPTRRKSA